MSATVTYTPCDSDAAVIEHAARWGVRPRWNAGELQYEAVRLEDGRPVEIAFCPAGVAA